MVRTREGQGKAGQMGGAVLGEPAEVQEDSDEGLEAAPEKVSRSVHQGPEFCVHHGPE